MTGYKHSLWKILSAVAALALLLPQLALGEFGVCPPYSKTFQPDDPEEDIEAFINEINLRPGGGTVRLEPGRYGDQVDAPWIQPAIITGVVCIESLSHEPDSVELGLILDIGSGGVVTLRYGPEAFASVGPGGTIFAESQQLNEVSNQGVAYFRDLHARGQIWNTGTMVWRGGEASEVRNSGWALFDQVRLSGWADCPTDEKCYGAYPAVTNSGVATFHRSLITEECEWPYLYQPECGGAIVNSSGSSVYVIGSTIEGEIENAGGAVEIGQSISDGCATLDAGYNVFSNGCTISESTSVQADPLFMPDSFELSAASPAIDRIPLELCAETDMLGRARTDGNADGTVACDSGALEYGYASVEVDVRTTPYWRTVGKVDLSLTNALFVAVMSGGPIDPTTIVFDSVAVGDFPHSALRGIGYGDKNGDGLPDYNVWYRLDKDLELECRYYDEPFSAQTDDGQQVTGRLRFEAMGCTD